MLLSRWAASLGNGSNSGQRQEPACMYCSVYGCILHKKCLLPWFSSSVPTEGAVSVHNRALCVCLCVLQSMLFVEVPSYRDSSICHSVKVNFYVINGKRKRSQPQHFSYTPLACKNAAQPLCGMLILITLWDYSVKWLLVLRVHGKWFLKHTTNKNTFFLIPVELFVSLL